ncbi:MAG: hypothetical protein QGI10_16980 [Vicinamibacterales bacterium]|nr:hypothetical protein [Candidatus Brocadiia bacterium]MDP7480954.1 hypothetical protein [Vicinamibacterales bacterium]HJN43751.1 hypothetical protein [Vicinamibacterales bacterium]
MIRLPLSRTLPLVSVLALSGACGGASSEEESGSQAPRPASEASAGPVKVDIDAIFPPGPGRDLVLNNCQSCHIWVPIVILQMDEAAWFRSSLEHRGRVEVLSDEEFETLYAYVSSTFTPDRPVPELPESLLEAWTSY